MNSTLRAQASQCLDFSLVKPGTDRMNPTYTSDQVNHEIMNKYHLQVTVSMIVYCTAKESSCVCIIHDIKASSCIRYKQFGLVVTTQITMHAPHIALFGFNFEISLPVLELSFLQCRPEKAVVLKVI